MNVGSLFSGIGGFDLGLEQAGMRIVWQCEANAYRRAVLRKHWPDVPCYEDVRAVDGRAERVDLICGGFPCQDLSLAGKGAGITGARSGLWSEFARIVGELRPRYVLVENVPALAHRGLGVVLADLAACGYDAEWDCIPASAFGAPHRRDRLWLVAYSDASGRGAGVGGVHARESDIARSGTHGPAFHELADASRNGEAGSAPQAWSERQRAGARGERSRAVADTDRQRCDSGTVDGFWSPRLDSGNHDGADWRKWWSVEPDVGRVAHGVPSRVDRLSALGDSLVPQIAEWIGRRILAVSLRGER